MNKRVVWFVIAVAAQLFILAAVPAQKTHARAAGKTILLKTAPVDTNSITRGNNIILGYEISNPAVSTEWKKWPEGKPVWITLKQDAGKIWNAVSVHDSRLSAPANCVVIKGKTVGGKIEYGIESLFFSEDIRDKVARDLLANPAGAKVEVKVDSFGKAAITKLIIQDRVYAY
jgi:uncharacterized membrane-anchored protein